jgi:type I restriction enzyme S subunit
MSWQNEDLGSFCKLVNGKAFKADDWSESGWPIIRIQNLNDPTKPFNHWNGGLERQVHVKHGDLLIAWSGTPGTSFGAHIWRGPEGVLNQHIFRVDLSNGLVTKGWLKFCVNTQLLRLIDQAHGGVGLKHVTKGAVESVQIPLPPLAEQKRIAGILDAADALRAKRRESLAQLDTLLQSTFLTLFGDCDRPPVSLGKPTFGNPANFVLLSSVATMATGHTPDRNRREYWNGGIPWIGLTEIRDLNGSIASETRENVSEKGIKNSSSVKLPKGTVCFSRTASVGFVTVMGREMATSQDFVNWVCGPKIDPIYVMWCLIFSRTYLLSKSAGSTHKTIYHRHTERFQIYLPPLPLQQEFATIVESIERQKVRLRAHLGELDALFASLQSCAFNGEL